MDSLSFDLTGLDAAVTALLHNVPHAFEQAGSVALFEEASLILADSQENYVPVDEGILRASGMVQPAEIQSGEIVVTLGYGGPASAYALAIHEHLSEHSPRSWKAAEAAGRPVQFHPGGRGPKYLETPVLNATRGIEDRLAARIGELAG